MFLHISFLSAFITIHYPPDSNSLIIEEEIIENQLSKGYFKAINANNENFNVIIAADDDENLYFNKENLTDIPSYFSFNNNEAETLIVEITRKTESDAKSYSHAKIEYKFETDFDTFNKDVAKSVRVEPAVEALISLEKLLYEIYIQSQSRRAKLHDLTRQHGMMVRYVSFLSVITLMLMICFSAYQLYAMKRFFKKKKLI